MKQTTRRTQLDVAYAHHSVAAEVDDLSVEHVAGEQDGSRDRFELSAGAEANAVDGHDRAPRGPTPGAGRAAG